MSSPTQFYKITQPAPNSDPWDVAFDSMISAFDTAIHSVELVVADRVSLVISHYPTATTCIGWQVAAPAWTVMSQAAFGRLVGSFSLQRSGAQVMLNLGLTGYVSITSQQAFITGPLAFFRGVIQPGSISVPSGRTNFTTESAWKFCSNVGFVHQNLNFQTVCSLGPGNFSIELQHRGASTSTGSVFAMDFNDWLVLTAREGNAIM